MGPHTASGHFPEQGHRFLLCQENRKGGAVEGSFLQHGINEFGSPTCSPSPPRPKPPTTKERSTSATTSTNGVGKLCTAFFRTTCSCSCCCPQPLCWSSWTPALSCPTCYANALPALHSHAHGLQSLWISATSPSTGLPPAAALPRLPWPRSGLSSPATTCTRLPRLSSTARRPWPATVEVDYGE